jgi:hypothetical protein
MTHLSEQDLLDTYYGEPPERGQEHLGECPECCAELARITELLDEVRNVAAPVRGEGYGREVWARLQPRLHEKKTSWWARPWILAPVAAALLTAAFLGGMLTMRHHQAAVSQQNRTITEAGLSENDRQRVFLGAMSDHLERSEVLLAQLVHAGPGDINLSGERTRARDLLDENRLLRETALRSGDQAHAALLDDLERVFLDLANSPAQLSSKDVAELQRRVENQGLLFKVRVTTSDARSTGQTL